MINKDTKIYGSFAKVAGNNGCKMFNPLFKYYKLNAIYKSFSVNNIKDAIEAARILNFSGFAVTMPFKKEAIKYIDILSDDVKEIGALNTVINSEGILKGYNTDFLAAQRTLKTYLNTYKKIFILGDGGYAAAVKHASKTLSLEYNIINRNNWNNLKYIKDSIVYNCTPVENIQVDDSNVFIDCIITTPTGYELSEIQASYQFKLYTNLDFIILDKK